MGLSFRDRARFEADRYGSDPWVFVRELLQNARDAGARRVKLLAEEQGGVWTVSCRDDGGGMTLGHARRYFFRLYSSSKEGEKSSAGRFGVGFWSVLRFEPEAIVVRSWPQGEPAWEVRLDGSLTRAEYGTPPPGPPGTEIVLARPVSGGDLGGRVFAAAWQAARFLERKDRPGRPIALTVNGRRVNAPFDLPPPCASFARGRARGVVGLGRAPGVELFSKGLRVRSAAFLSDFSLSSRGTRTSPEAPEGLSPRALLESSDLELELARGDARDDRALRRLVRLAERELERLLSEQLDALRPRSRWRGHLVAGAILFLVAGLGLGLASQWPARGEGAPPPVAVAGGSPAAPLAYRDLAARYPGPQMETSDDGLAPVRLRYTPPEQRLHFAAFVVEVLDARGRAQPMPLAQAPARSYTGVSCHTGCVEVRLLVEGGDEAVRLPLPTGHRLDAESVRLAGEPLAVFASAADEPFVRPRTTSPATVVYRTSPARAAVRSSWPTPAALPPAAARFAVELLSLPRQARPPRALEWVRHAISYTRLPEVAARHRQAEALEIGFVERSLAIGAGDCDVQNGVLALLLQASGVPARLAVGYLGEGGSVGPWLHAWVEYQGGDGAWRAADASEGGPAGGPPSRRAPTPLAAVGAPVPVAPFALAALGALVALASLGVVRRTRRTFQLDPDGSVADVLQGALTQPEAFGPGSAVFHRRLVPLAPRGSFSLAEAWDLAAKGTLYATGTQSPLAVEAASRGWRVVDAARPEGRTVAEALGAVDLDEWDRLLDRSRTSPPLDALNEHLRRNGERWTVRVAPTPGPVVVRLPRRWGSTRVVVLDETEPWVRDSTTRRPAEGLFLLADRVLLLLDLPEERRCALLAPLARAAVLEADRC